MPIASVIASETDTAAQVHSCALGWFLQLRAMRMLQRQKLHLLAGATVCASEGGSPAWELAAAGSERPAAAEHSPSCWAAGRVSAGGGAGSAAGPPAPPGLSEVPSRPPRSGCGSGSSGGAPCRITR